MNCRNQILIIIAMSLVFFGIGSINAQKMKTEVPKISEFSVGNDVEHWHGAAPDSWFSHIAVECNPQNNKNTWLERVSDEDYAQAVAQDV